MINHRRINFCGAQGTGKTTLFEAVKKDEMFKGWNFYSEVVRQMLEREEVVINEMVILNHRRRFLMLITKFSIRCLIILQ